MSAAADLLSNYQHVISSLELVPGADGIFDVEVDGTLLYSKHAVRRHASPGEILESFEQTFGRGVARYGS